MKRSKMQATYGLTKRGYRRTFKGTALAGLLASMALANGGCAGAQTRPAPASAANTNAAATITNRPDIGVGLEGLADWSRSYMFVDAMTTSRKWSSTNTPWDGKAAVDANGWPTEDAGIVVLVGATDIGGTYKLSFVGQAEVEGRASHLKVENKKYDQATNTTTADVVVEPKSEQIMLAFTRTKGGVKNVKLLRPGYEANTKEVFHRPFLERLKPFKTIRFMDFLSTNNNVTTNWADRTLKTHARQTREFNEQGAGAALEYAIELCNLVDADMWVNVPDMATDDYVRQMAALIKAQLEPQRKVYVEWSNEVWNWQFAQAQRNLQSAKAEVAAGNSKLNYDKSDNEGYWAMRRIAKRSKEVGEIFREVFGDKDMSRVRPIYATQTGYEEVYKQGLQLIEEAYGPPANYFYAIAGAPYFNLPKELDEKKDLTVDEIFAALPKGIDDVLGMAATLGSHARYHNLKHFAYEGGQHLQDHGNIGNADVKVAANRDPRMGPMVEKYLNGWNAIGGDLFMYFVLASGYSKWGSWGLTEDITKGSPKYDAAVKVLNTARAPLTVGTAIPGTVAAGDFMSQSQWAKKGSEFVRFGNGTWYNYFVRVPATGTYKIGVGATSTAADGKLEVLVNSKSLGTIAIPNTGGDNTWNDSPTVTANLEAGLHVIRLKSAGGSFGVQTLKVTR